MSGMHRSEDLRSKKESRQQILFIILEYGVSLTDTSDAILLNTILASFPMPPVEENTKEKNEQCSISLILWPNTRIFPIHAFCMLWITGLNGYFVCWGKKP